MYFKSVTALFVVFLMMGCSKDDDQNSEIANSNTFDESWFMVHSIGGFAGDQAAIPRGEVVWTFVKQDSAVTVVNEYSNPGHAVYSGPSTGNYTFSTAVINNRDLLFFNGERVGVYRKSGDTLIVKQVVGDGYTYTLVR